MRQGSCWWWVLWEYARVAQRRRVGAGVLEQCAAAQRVSRATDVYVVVSVWLSIFATFSRRSECVHRRRVAGRTSLGRAIYKNVCLGRWATCANNCTVCSFVEEQIGSGLILRVYSSDRARMPEPRGHSRSAGNGEA